MNRRCGFFLGVAVLLLALSPRLGGQESGKDAKMLAAKAQEAASAKDLPAAIDLMKKAIKLAPDNDVFLGMASDWEFKAGLFADGLAHAQAAIKLKGDGGAYYVLAAMNAHADQELDLAREYCATVIKRGKEFGPGLVNDATFLLQEFLSQKTYTLFWKLDPSKGRVVGGVLSVALPRDGLPYQQVSYEISGVKSHKLVKGEVNDLLQVTPKGKESFPLTVKITALPYSYKKELAAVSAKAGAKPLPAEAKANLGPILGADPNSAALKKIAAGLKSEDSLATVRNVQAWLKKNVDYKLQKKSIAELDFKTVDEIVQRGHAECRGYALLFTGLCRAAGVPARPIWGLYRVPPNGDRQYGDIVSHNWAEVYIAGSGWIPVDPQRPETLGGLSIHYLRFFMDAQKSSATAESQPMRNLLFMHDAKLRFEESR